MATTQTFLRPSVVVHAALFDELEKISEATQPQDNKTKIKKWLKNTALITAGAGAGAAATTVLDKILRDNLGNYWKSMSPTTKRLIVGPLIGISTVGALAAAHKLQQARMKDENV